jgi:hypothetical protein
MQRSAFVALLLTAAAFAPRTAAAGYNLPWCANYYEPPNVIACSFTSFAQCMASVSGVGGHCTQNILYPPPPPPYVEPHRLKSRRAS